MDKNLYAIFFALLFSVSAGARDVRNPGLQPLGHTEALLGNAGVAHESSATSSYYNPAAIRIGEGVDFVANTQSIVLNTFSLTNTTATDNTTTELDVIPNMILSTGTGSWAFSLSILNLIKGTLESEIIETVNGLNKTTIISSEEESFLVGLSSKYKFNKVFSMGLTLFFERYQDNYFINIKQVDGSSASDFVVINKDNRLVHNLYSVLGFLFTWNDVYSTGLRVQLPGFRIQGDVDHFDAAKGTNKSVSVDSEFSNIFSANQKIPIDLVLGNSVLLGGHRLLLDIGLQLPLSFNSIVDSRTSTQGRSERIETKTTLRFHAGYGVKLTEKLSLLTGFQYNPSTVKSNVDDLAVGEKLDKNSRKAFQVSGGLLFHLKDVELSIGGFYSRGTLNFFDSSEFGTETQREAIVQSAGGQISLKMKL